MKEIKWGLIFVVAIILWMIIERLAGLHTHNIQYHAIFTNVFAVVAIVIYILALRDKRASLPNQEMTWLQGFISGLKIAVVVAVLSPAVQLLVHYVISPQFFPNMKNHAIESGVMSEDRAEKYFNLTSYMMQSAIGALAMGAITAAIVAFFLKRRS